MFFQLIKKLQSLPQEKRQMLTLLLSITTTAIIFGFWLTTFNQKTNELAGETNNDNDTAIEKTAAASPFAAISGAFKNLTEELSNRIGEFSDQIANFQKTEVWNSYSSSTVSQTFEITGN